MNINEKIKEVRSAISELFGEKSASSVTVDSAMKIAAIYSCIKVISETIGQMSVTVYETTSGIRKPKPESPLQYLLHDSPNQGMTSSVFQETLMVRALIYGNAYARIERKFSIPTALHIITKPVKVSYVEKTSEIFYEIEGDKKKYPAYEIIHIKNISRDGILGISPIDELNEVIELGMSQQEFANSFFKNGATVNAILSKDGTLTREQSDSMVERWRKAFGNKMKKGNGTAVLDGGWKYQAIGNNPQDSQLMESRKFSIGEISRIFRVPLHMISELENATFSNIEAQGIEFSKYTISPWVRKIEQEYKSKLFLEKEKINMSAKFNIESLMRGDTAARTAMYVQAIQNGWMSPNEVRQLEGWNPRDGGDIYLTPLNMLTTEVKK